MVKTLSCIFTFSFCINFETETIISKSLMLDEL